MLEEIMGRSLCANALTKLQDEIFDIGEYIQFEQCDVRDYEISNDLDENNVELEKPVDIDSIPYYVESSLGRLVSMLPRKYNVIATQDIEASSQVFLVDHMWYVKKYVY